MSEKLIFGLDIGGSKIVAIVANIGQNFSVTGISSYYFLANEHDNDQVVTSGVVSNIHKVSEYAMNCLHEAKEMADCSYGAVVMNVSSVNVRNLYSIQNYEMNGETFGYDMISKIINEVKDKELPNGFEILDYEVQEYLINNDFYAKNPVDLSCDNVVSHVNLFVAKSINLKNLKKILEKNLNYTVAKIVPSAILSAAGVLTYEEKISGCCMIDIGASTSDVVVYENGYLRELFVIPFGGNSIINELRNALKLSRDVAEEILLNFSHCGSIATNVSGNAKIKTLNHRSEYVEIPVKKIHDIIVNKLQNIFGLTREKLINDGLYDIIEAGFIITGGISLLPGINKKAEKYFEAPVRTGIPIFEGEFADILANPKYATVVGIIKFSQELFVNDDSALDSGGIEVKVIFNKIKNIFKNM